MTLRQLKRKYLAEGVRLGYRKALREKFIGSDPADQMLYKQILKSLNAVYKDEKAFAEEEGIELDLLTIADKWQMNDYAERFGINREELIDRYDPLIQALTYFAKKYRFDLDELDDALDIMQEY